jgi:hypothetical protein
VTLITSPRSESWASTSTTHCGRPVSRSTFCTSLPKSLRASAALVTWKPTADVSSNRRIMTTTPSSGSLQCRG